EGDGVAFGLEGDGGGSSVAAGFFLAVENEEPFGSAFAEKGKVGFVAAEVRVLDVFEGAALLFAVEADGAFVALLFDPCEMVSGDDGLFYFGAWGDFGEEIFVERGRRRFSGLRMGWGEREEEDCG